jgi:mannose-6-phosphate isomerase-like protein (cupin superfamily)
MNIAANRPQRNGSVVWMGSEYRTRLTSTDSTGLIGMFESRVPAGKGPPLHIHHNEDEVLHVLEGQYEFWLDGATVRGGPGTTMFLPRGVPHTFRVVGEKPGRNLAIVMPGGFEGFFAEVAARDLMLPRDMPQLVETGGLYGIEFVGPSPWPAED